MRHRKKNVVEDTYIPRARGRVFYQGYIQLSDLDGKAGIHGETLASVDADEVGLYLYLEQYNGNSFSTYDYWKTVEYNASMNIKGYTISVPPRLLLPSPGFSTTLTPMEFMRAGETITEGLKNSPVNFSIFFQSILTSIQQFLQEELPSEAAALPQISEVSQLFTLLIFEEKRRFHPRCTKARFPPGQRFLENAQISEFQKILRTVSR